MIKKRILIIDDEEDFCELVRKNLELSSNFKVDTAISGKEGIKLAKAIKPDLILLDILMPGMDGFEVLKELKRDKDTAMVPVVMLTARKDDESKSKAAQLYDSGYITKPIEALDLKTEIEEVLRRRGFEGYIHKPIEASDLKIRIEEVLRRKGIVKKKKKKKE